MEIKKKGKNKFDRFGVICVKQDARWRNLDSYLGSDQFWSYCSIQAWKLALAGRALGKPCL